MALRHTTVFPVSTDDDLIRLEQELPEYHNETVVLEIASEADVLTNAIDFRWLRRITRDAGVNLEIATDDPIHRELAKIFDIPVAGEADRTSITTRFALSEQPTVERAAESDQPTVASPNPGSRSTPDADTIPRLQQNRTPPDTGRNAGNTTAESATTATESEPSFSFVIAPPVPRRPELAHGWAAPAPEPAGWNRARPGTLNRGAVVGTIAANATVAAIIVLLIGFLAPSAQVTLVPATQESTTELTYGVAGSGQVYDLALDPVPVSTTRTFETTIPTTGERFEPDGTATGAVLFTNSQTEERAVPAGTRLTAADGTAFVTEQAVTVPAADPFGSLTFGSATATVRAEVAGTDGNADAGAITGQLASGVFYNNREPITGGTMKRIAVVAEEDLDTLRVQAESALLEDSEQAVQEELGNAQELVPGSVESGELNLSFNREAGEDAETVSVTGSVQHSGYAYMPDELHDRANEAVADQLAGQIGPDQELLADSVRISEPEPIDDESAGFRIRAAGQARAILDETEIDRLRSGLVGASESEAERLVAGLDGVETFAVHYGPDWLPVGKEPRLKSRVTIEIGNEQKAAAQ